MKVMASDVSRTQDYETPSGREPSSPRLALPGSLARRRLPICRGISDAMASTPKYAAFRKGTAEDDDTFALRCFQVLVDCLALHFRTQDATYRDIFIGEIVKVAHVPAGDIDALVDSRRTGRGCRGRERARAVPARPRARGLPVAGVVPGVDWPRGEGAHVAAARLALDGGLPVPGGRVVPRRTAARAGGRAQSDVHGVATTRWRWSA